MTPVCIDVAVGVVFNSLGQILVAKRLPHQHQGECWEFPGGKIEPGESEANALKRELLEEVGIQVLQHEPWLEVQHHYTDKSVCLKVHRVTSHLGEAKGLEGQEIRWLHPSQIALLTLPQANQSIINALLSYQTQIS